MLRRAARGIVMALAARSSVRLPDLLFRSHDAVAYMAYRLGYFEFNYTVYTYS